MAINGYLIYNFTQENQDIFKSQIDGFIESFKKVNIDLKTVNNFDALDVLNHDPKYKFILFWDKDLALLQSLYNFKKPVFNNLYSITICDDKAYTYSKLVKSNVRTPKTYVLPLTFNKPINNYFEKIKLNINKNEINYPLIVKERKSSLGLGVYLINNEKELLKILDEKWEKELLIQEYIGFEKGVDYRVYLIENRPVIAVKRKNNNDYRSNIEQGAKMEIIDNPDEELLKIAMKASLATKIDFGAVDIVKDKDGLYYVLEVNSNARTMTFDKLFDKKITDKIAEYIKLRV